MRLFFPLKIKFLASTLHSKDNEIELIENLNTTWIFRCVQRRFFANYSKRYWYSRISQYRFSRDQRNLGIEIRLFKLHAVGWHNDSGFHRSNEVNSTVFQMILNFDINHFTLFGRVLTLNGEDMEETEFPGLISDEQTFYCGNVGKEFIIQITTGYVRLISIASKDKVR